MGHYGAAFYDIALVLKLMHGNVKSNSMSHLGLKTRPSDFAKLFDPRYEVENGPW